MNIEIQHCIHALNVITYKLNTQSILIALLAQAKLFALHALKENVHFLKN